MQLIIDTVKCRTRGNTDIIDLTEPLRQCLSGSQLREGVLTAFVPGSTAALTTIEYEPGLLEDLPAFFEKIAPRDYPYRHHDTWHDDNGSAHVRAAFVGPSISIPFAGGKLTLGTWQQVILIDFDTRPRSRELPVHMIGTREPGKDE